MMQGQPQPMGQGPRPAQPARPQQQQPLREGMTGIDNATGRPVVVRGGQVVFADQPPPPAFNTVRGAPPGVMSNQLNREDEILQGAADERSRLSTANQQATRFEALMDQGQSTGGLLRFDPVRGIVAAFDPQVSEMEQINNALAPLQRQAGSGAMSDRDLAVFQRSIVSPELAEQPNRAYIAMTRAANQNARDYEDFLQNYRAMYGPGSLADGQRLWRQYTTANPMFNDDGTVREGRLSWRQHFGMEQAGVGSQQPRSIPLADRPTTNRRISERSAPSSIGGNQFTLTPAARDAYSRLPGGGFDSRAPEGSLQRPFYLGPIPETDLFVGSYGVTPDGRLIEGQRPRPVQMPRQQPRQGAQQPTGGQQPRAGQPVPASDLPF